jgi:hypothetical protein
MAWFGRKKEEKKKFDYSDETKELFAERDAWTAEQRRKLGGETSNPELANQPNSEAPKSRTEDLDDLLGDSDGFDCLANSGLDVSPPNFLRCSACHASLSANSSFVSSE